MNWTNKHNDFRIECIIALREALKKGYDYEELWNSEDDERYEIPTSPYVDKHMDYESYALILWDGNSFKGIGRESGDYFWFDIDDLETRTICHLIDLINENK